MSEPKSCFIQTFGCQMNEAESEQIAAWYESRGWKRADSWKTADEVVINSCSVREAAENRVFGLVNNISQARGKKTKPRVILTGCMVGSASGDRRRFSLHQLKQRLPQVAEFRPWSYWGFERLKAISTRKDRKTALIPIMKGCNHFCTYCVVPYAKGEEVSLPFNQIVCQVEELSQKGWENFILLGQNVNSYIGEKNRAKASFASLLTAVHQLPGVKKVSFLTSNPWDLTDEIIKAIKLAKVDRLLHLPLQSGDDKILRKMNRPYTAVEYLNLVAKIKKEIPAIRFSTDIIVGFPGETKKAFLNTIKISKQVGFEMAYVAIYSPRPGTAAFKLKDEVPHQEKKRRWLVLDKLINRKFR